MLRQLSRPKFISPLPPQRRGNGVPDERGDSQIPGPCQEALGGGLPLGGHLGAAVGAGVGAGSAGTGGVRRPDRLRGAHCQGLHLQHAGYVDMFQCGVKVAGLIAPAVSHEVMSAAL